MAPSLAVWTYDVRRGALSILSDPKIGRHSLTSMRKLAEITEWASDDGPNILANDFNLVSQTRPIYFLLGP